MADWPIDVVSNDRFALLGQARESENQFEIDRERQRGARGSPGDGEATRRGAQVLRHILKYKKTFSHKQRVA